ncbi:hypothetical protein ACVW16_004170 [Bradyrhizobium sp. USDA 4474]
MLECPKYRTRAFLSVDLVGSTAFKAGEGSKPTGQAAYPKWVDETRKFYADFPLLLRGRYNHVTHGDEDIQSNWPRLWKTIGDEIVFCVRVLSRNHLACIVQAFTEALREYGHRLEERGKHLDVKGTAWLASFPAPNVTVPIERVEAFDIPSEEMELVADETPHRFDFLGKNIDCGFRLAKFSSADKLTLSVELALELCDSISVTEIFRGSFHYLGREELKGVLNGRPYPIVAVYTERRAVRRHVVDLEMDITINRNIKPLKLGEFLRRFMQDEEMDSLLLEGAPSPLPQAYVDFCAQWEPLAKEETQRGAAENAAAGPVDGTGGIPQNVEDAFEKIVQPVEGVSASGAASGLSTDAKPDAEGQRL